MPKDQWASDKAKEIARKAIACGEFDKVVSTSLEKKRIQKANAKKLREKQKSDRKKAAIKNKKSRRAKQAEMQQLAANGICPRCVNSFVNKSVRTFKDGTMHIEQRCGMCDRFIKWGN